MNQGFCRMEVLFDETGAEPVDFHYLELNPVFARESGLPPDAQGKTIREMVPDIDPFWFDFYGQVALTGEAAHREYPVPQLGRWYEVHTFRLGPPAARQVGVLFTDITARWLAEQQRAFLLQFSDALRPLAAPTTVAEQACRLVVEQMGASRAQYTLVEGEPGDEMGAVCGEYIRRGQPMPRRYPYAGFGENLVALLRAGQTLVLSDANHDPRLTPEQRALYAAVESLAAISVPLVKAGRLVANFTVHDRAPRPWTAADVALLEAVAERTWAAVERANVEEALRASEATYRTLFETMDEGFVLVDVVGDAAGRATAYRFVEANQAFEQQTGVRDVIGQLSSAFLPEQDESAWVARYDDVARTGVSQRFEDYHAPTGRWYLGHVSRVGHAGSRRVAIVFNDITERKERERQQAFLLTFSDELRTLGEATTIEETGVRMLAEYLRLDRAYVFVLYPAEDRAVVRSEQRAAHFASLVGEVRMSDFPETVVQIEDETLVVHDTDSDARLSASNRASLHAVNLQAFVCASVRKGEKTVVWSLAAVSATPRTWTTAEVELIEIVAERMWATAEKAKAEEALRTSEEKYRTLFDTMAEGLAICGVERDAAGQVVDLRYRELNQALEALTGLNHEAMLGQPLSAVLPPADLARWLPRYAAVSRSGEPAHFEEYTVLLDRWFAVSLYPRLSDELTVFYRDITARKRREADAALLVALSGDLDRLAGEEEMLVAVGAHLARHLRLACWHYVDVDDARGEVTLRHFWHAQPVPAILGTYPITGFLAPGVVADLRDGAPAVVADVQADIPADSAAGVSLRSGAAAQHIGAYIAVPYSVSGRWKAYFAVADSRPRQWTGGELALVLDVAARVFPRIERARAEQALRVSEDWFRAVANLVPDLLWRSDADSHTTWYNQRWYAYTGQTPEEAADYGWTAVIHPDDRAESDRLYRDSVVTGHPLRQEHRIRSAAGAYRWFQVEARPVRDAHGAVTAWFGAATDIHQHKLVVEAAAASNAWLEQAVAERTRELRESRDWLRSVFDTSLVAMSVLQAERDAAGEVFDFRLLAVNKELERQTGRTDLVGRLYAQEYPGIVAVGIYDLLLRTLATGQPQMLEYHYNHDGINRWFACQFVQLGDGVVATNLDITARKQAEAERLKNLQLLEQAETVVGLGSWEFDLPTQQFTWSTGMYHLFGLPVGQPVRPGVMLEFIVEPSRAQAEDLLHRLTTGAGDLQDTVRLRVGPELKTVRIRAVVLRDAQGQPQRVLGVNLDISELQRLEADNLRLRLTQQRALFEAVQAAQEEERRRIAEGLHNGVGQTLYATKLQFDQLQPMLPNEAWQKFTKLLADAIRQTRAISHELVPMVLNEFGLGSALTDVCRTLSFARLHFNCEIDLAELTQPVPASLQLAVYRMAQELAQNIVKHVQATEATLALEAVTGFLLLRAEDNGVGFPAEPTERPGLGLRTIRDRVALLGGTVDMGSAPSVGTYVRLRLPLPDASG